MNTPTTLYTALLAAVPALIAPAQACPFCRKGEPHDPVINWNAEVIVRGCEDFIQLLQPLTTGNVRAQKGDNEMAHIVFMGTEDDKVSISAPCGEFLCIYLPDNCGQDVFPRIMRGLNRLTINGKLRNVHLSELERVLSEEVEYEPIMWDNVSISAPESMLGTAKALAEQLSPPTAGKVNVATEQPAQGTTIIQLSIHQAPTQAKAIAGQNSIQLCINHNDEADIAVEHFMQVLRQIAAEDGGMLHSVSEKRLNTAFHEAYRVHIIDWQHIAIPTEPGEEVADWFREHTNAIVELYDDDATINYTQHTLLVKVHKERNWSLMTVAADITPTLHLSIARKRKDSTLTDTEYRQAVALQLLEWLRPLMKDGKLPPVTVEELQQHLRKTKRPMRQP